MQPLPPFVVTKLRCSFRKSRHDIGETISRMRARHVHNPAQQAQGVVRKLRRQIGMAVLAVAAELEDKNVRVSGWNKKIGD